MVGGPGAGFLPQAAASAAEPPTTTWRRVGRKSFIRPRLYSPLLTGEGKGEASPGGRGRLFQSTSLLLAWCAGAACAGAGASTGAGEASADGFCTGGALRGDGPLGALAGAALAGLATATVFGCGSVFFEIAATLLFFAAGVAFAAGATTASALDSFAVEAWSSASTL